MLIPFFYSRLDISMKISYNPNMDTKLKEAPKCPKRVEQSSRGKFIREDLIEAIKKAFKGTNGRIDARFLWMSCGVHRFRVNCWSDREIQYSEFVHVIEENGKLIVRRER